MHLANSSESHPNVAQPARKKQTEIGEIPENWQVFSLAEKFETQLGKMLSQKAHQGTDPKPYIRNANVQWGRVETKDLLRMDFSESEQEKFRLRRGDLLVCEGGEIGRTALWQGEVAECYFQKAIHRLRPKSTDILPQFFLYWMERCFRLANTYKLHGARTTIAHLPQDKLGRLRIPVPSIDEQRVIVEVLQSLQNAIRVRENELALERESKAALMNHLFKNGTRGETLKSTELGLVPESWTTTTLENVSREPPQNGAFIKGARFGQGIRYVNVYDIYQNAVLVLNAVERVNWQDPSQSRYLLKQNDVLFVRSSLKREGVGQCCLVGELGEPAIFDCHLIRISPDERKVRPLFLTYFFLCDARRSDLIARAKTTTMTTINQNTIVQSQIALPLFEEQNEICSVLAACDRKIATLKRELTCLGELFDAMLDQLMIGRVSPSALLKGSYE